MFSGDTQAPAGLGLTRDEARKQRSALYAVAYSFTPMATRDQPTDKAPSKAQVQQLSFTGVPVWSDHGEWEEVDGGIACARPGMHSGHIERFAWGKDGRLRVKMRMDDTLHGMREYNSAMQSVKRDVSLMMLRDAQGKWRVHHLALVHTGEVDGTHIYRGKCPRDQTKNFGNRLAGMPAGKNASYVHMPADKSTKRMRCFSERPAEDADAAKQKTNARAAGSNSDCVVFYSANRVQCIVRKRTSSDMSQPKQAAAQEEKPVADESQPMDAQDDQQQQQQEIDPEMVEYASRIAKLDEDPELKTDAQKNERLTEMLLEEKQRMLKEMREMKEQLERSSKQSQELEHLAKQQSMSETAVVFDVVNERIAQEEQQGTAQQETSLAYHMNAMGMTPEKRAELSDRIKNSEDMQLRNGFAGFSNAWISYAAAQSEAAGSATSNLEQSRQQQQTDFAVRQKRAAMLNKFLRIPGSSSAPAKSCAASVPAAAAPAAQKQPLAQAGVGYGHGFGAQKRTPSSSSSHAPEPKRTMDSEPYQGSDFMQAERDIARLKSMGCYGLEIARDPQWS